MFFEILSLKTILTFNVTLGCQNKEGNRFSLFVKLPIAEMVHLYQYKRGWLKVFLFFKKTIQEHRLNMNNSYIKKKCI